MGAHRDDLAAHLLRVLRHVVDDGGFSVGRAVDVVHEQLKDHHRLRLSFAEHARLKPVIANLARALDPAAPRTWLAFAQSVADTALTLAERKHKTLGDVVNNPRAAAEAAIRMEAPYATNDADLVRRAVLRAVRLRKRGTPGLTRVDVDDGSPVRALLDLPKVGAVVLPRVDVRTHMVGITHTAGFGELLRDAALFSADLLRPALGEELWSLGQPAGFADKARSRVVVRVTSSVMGQEVQLRSQELVHRLRAVPGFAQVKGIKLHMEPARALPIR